MIIKILLIAGVVGAVMFALRGSNSTSNLALRRLAGIAFAGAAALSILFPDAVTWVANLIDVGRGTDLLLYTLVVAFLYVTIALYQRIHHLEELLIQLTRELALARPEPAASEPPDPEPEG